MAVTVVDNNILTNNNNNVLDFQPYQAPANVIPASSWTQVGSAIWSPYMTYYIHQAYVYNTYYYKASEAQYVANAFPGWHLPTSSDFQYLKDYTAPSGAYKLKTTSGWLFGNGNDQYGFGWKRLGFYQNPGTSNDFFASNCPIWGSTVSSSPIGESRVCLSVIDSRDYLEPTFVNEDIFHMYIPVRLVKDS